MWLEADDKVLTRCRFTAAPPGGAACASPDSAVLRTAAAQLEEYFRGERMAFTVPLAPAPTPFSRRVRSALLQVPFGQTVTYAELADMAGCPGGARAVGNAMHSNPFPVIVPCHRVVPSGGGIGSYTPSPAIKEKLLGHERIISDGNFFKSENL